MARTKEQNGNNFLWRKKLIFQHLMLAIKFGFVIANYKQPFSFFFLIFN